ncbi:MAG: asparagine synthase-related protein [Gammaproteobacteria bacterium]
MNVDINIFPEQAGWSQRELPQRRKLWFKGYLHGTAMDTLCAEAAGLSKDRLAAWLQTLDGHFALLIETPQWTMAAVDKVRSSPLFYVGHNGRWWVDAHAPRLADAAEMAAADIDAEAALSIAMSGYVVGNRTLYRHLQTIAPGQALLFSGALPESINYYQFKPWQTVAGDYRDYLAELSGLTLRVLSNMLATIGKRQIVIPLSAGHDSRLIASGLKRLGAENVKCFTYGIKDNFEAYVSRRVAERLGYEWRFVLLSHGREKRFFRSDEFNAYWRYADSYTAVPYIQGLSALKYLKESGWIEDDAVFVNGNTGDFISGGHIPKTIDTSVAASKRECLRYIEDELLKKHFSLWDALKTEPNLAAMRHCLAAEIAQVDNENIAADNMHGLYEYMEFQTRQTKYIIPNQRIYEFYGYDWRLPLWSDDYLRFWEKVPQRFKRGQKLYKDMLRENNWGNVWSGDIPVNMSEEDVVIRPKWIVPLRNIAKLFFAPFGKRGKTAWRRFEMNVFYYWRDVGVTAAAFPYSKLLFDRRGARHVVAYMAEKYLAEKNIKIPGLNGR